MKRRPGHASVEEHPKGSGLYRVRIRAGKSFKTLGSKLTKGAALELANAQAALRHDVDMRQGMTLGQFGVAYMDRRELLGVRAIRTDRASWNKHMARDPIAGLPVSTISRLDIVDWLDRRRASAYRTRIRLLNLFRAALQDAMERGLIGMNPAREVRVHRAGGASGRDDLEGILTPDEQKRLIAAIPLERDKAMVVFAMCTGLRLSEQWRLEWSDVRVDRIVVRRSAGGLAPKSGKPREVFLLPAAKAALEALWRRPGLVFPGARGARREDGKQPRQWKGWLLAAGIKRRVRWHDLRHTCATSLLAGWWGSKWSLDEVAKMLGHSSIAVTERYARKLNETLEQAVLRTPMLLFPYGNTEGPMVPKLQAKTGKFVKHRSSVQIRQSAPALPERVREHSGNSGAEPALGHKLGWFGPNDPPGTESDFSFLQADLGGVAP
jgi:integrase